MPAGGVTSAVARRVGCGILYLIRPTDSRRKDRHGLPASVRGPRRSSPGMDLLARASAVAPGREFATWSPAGGPLAPPPALAKPCSADKDAAAEARVESEVAFEDAQVRPVEHFQVRAAALAGPGDDVGDAVAVDVRRPDNDAAAEVSAEGCEALQERQVSAAEDLHQRPAAGAFAGDDVGDSVAVHVRGGDECPAAEGRV